MQSQLKRYFGKAGCGKFSPKTEALASASDVSAHTIQSLYLGRRNARPSTAKKLQAALAAIRANRKR